MRDSKSVREYRVLDKDIAVFEDKLNGSGSFEMKLFIPTMENRAMMQSELDVLFERHRNLEASDEVFSIVKDHTGDFLEGLQSDLDNLYNAPSGRILSALGFSFITLIRRDTRPEPMRIKILEARMLQCETLFTAIFDLLGELHVGELNQFLSRMINLCETIKTEQEDLHLFINCRNDDDFKMLMCKVQSFIDIINDRIDDLKIMIADKGEVPKIIQRGEGEVLPQDIDVYRNALRAHDVDLDEILSWHEAEIEKTRNECFSIANSLDIPDVPVKTMTQVNDILLKYAGPAGSAEEMYERATEYVTRGTAAAREYVWLPDDADCPPMVMYKQMKKSYPWGAGGSASPYSRPFEGRFMLNDENYHAITDGWIKINCTHEVHPGHYTQFLRSLLDPLPETMKRGAKNTCLTEGMCIRTEKLFEYIFPEDKFYPLFTAYRRHHTSVRIMVDLWLRYFGKTIGDALDLYVRELGFDRNSARIQVQAHENDYGYFTTYYYGYRKVAEWESLYGFDKKEYTELLFSLSRVSLNTFERYLKLSEADRFSLTHEFASLIQFK